MSGFGLVGTYNETSFANRARWVPPYNDPQSAETLLAVENPTEVRVDQAFRRQSFDLVQEHPLYPLEVAFWNTIRGFDLDGGAYTRYLAPYLPYPPHLLNPAIFGGWVLLLLAAVGTRSPRIRTVPVALWAIPILFTIATAFLLPFNIRYRSILEPFMILLATAAILRLVDRSEPAGPEAEPAAPSRARRRPLVADPDPAG
jgi:hypothetical protein